MASRIIRGGIVTAEVMDAKEEAAAIVEAAKNDAAEIRRAAEQHAEQWSREAREKGENEARTALAAQVAAAAAKADAILAAAENSLSTLALAVAGHIVRDVLDQHPELVRRRVEQVLTNARRAKEVRVYVHPNDLVHVEGLAGIETLSDPDLTPGDCVVETDLGRLDGRIHVQMEALKRALAEQK